WFRTSGQHAASVLTFLREGLGEVQGILQAEHLVLDPDRREELVRRGLRALVLRPAGETREQAEGRLTTLDSMERALLIEESEALEERARQIREEMARKAAQEAAANYTNY